MERVETLLQNLQQQFNNKASVQQLLLTVQMLQHELTHLQTNQPNLLKEAVSISMPLQAILPQQPTTNNVGKTAAGEDKIVTILQIDEAEVAAELEEIKRTEALLQQKNSLNRSPVFFEDDDEEEVAFKEEKVPLIFKEINQNAGVEPASINESLKEKKIEISETLFGLPVKDLKKAIGINDRFLYINDLFRGDDVMYERSIKTINSFAIWPEAEYWIRRELKTKLGWSDNDDTVKQFDQLIKRRFS